MEYGEILEAIKTSFGNNIGLKNIKPNVFQVLIPYYHEDGDMIDIFIEEIWGQLVIKDFGQTLMRLSYVTDIDTKNKKQIFNNILASMRVQSDNGILYVNVQKLENICGDIMDMAAAITKVSDISLLKRETIKSMFYEYFDKYITETFWIYDLHKDYIFEQDKAKEYEAPYALLSTKLTSPIVVFPILTTDKCKDAIMSTLSYKLRKIPVRTIWVFQDYEDIQGTAYSKFTNLAHKSFITLDGAKEYMGEYVEEMIIG